MSKRVFFWLVLSCITAYKPIVLWHGMGDSCCNPKSLGHLMKVLKDNLPGVYIKSIRTGDTDDKDVRSGYIGNIQNQVKGACNDLEQDAKLKDGFNAIGISQVKFMNNIIGGIIS